MQDFQVAGKQDKLKTAFDLKKSAMRKIYPITTGLVREFCQLSEKLTLNRTSESYSTTTLCS